MSWRATDMGDLTGKVAIVTGATSGIGFVEAKELAAHGATVILAVRDTAAGAACAARIEGSTSVERLDLASQKSVRDFAERIEGPVDILINNAGLMEPPAYRETEDGFELQYGTNHLGHFTLTGRLLPNLLQAEAPRVVAVSSIAHHRGNASVLTPVAPGEYKSSITYGNSKLANLLFATELQRRATEAGSKLTATAAHPGIAVTGLIADPDGWGANRFARHVLPRLMRIALPGADGGAQPILFAATDAEPGSYSGPTGPKEVRGKVGPAKRSRAATDQELARRLFDLSEEQTGVTFDI